MLSLISKSGNLDTLKSAGFLTDNGFNKKQAESCIQLLDNMQQHNVKKTDLTHLATKLDIKYIENQISKAQLNNAILMISCFLALAAFIKL